MSNSEVLKKYIYTAISLVVISIFWFIPPIEPLTAVGMKMVGTFLAMIILWSTVGMLWPSLLGLFFFAMSGYGGNGAKGFKAVMTGAFGNETVLLVLFAMLLFGAMSVAGVPKYVANWILTRKVINGKPYVFLSFVFIVGFLMAGFTSAVASMIILMPLVIKLAEALGLNKNDQIWKYLFVGLFLSINFGRPFLPYKGTVSGIIGAFNEMTGNANDIIFIKWMIMVATMGAIFMIIYILVLKFIIKPDVSKLENINVEQIDDKSLGKMNFAQKMYLIMVPLYMIMLIAPTILPKDFPFVTVLNQMGAVGISVFWLVVFSIVHYNGKPLLDFKEVASKQFNWGVFFMIPVAIYGAKALADDAVGFKALLVNVLEPIISGKPELFFVFVVFAFCLLVSNVANNSSIALVFMPVILVLCEQLGIAFAPVAMAMSGIVFAAMLTPGASPQTALMFGNTDVYDTKDIYKIGIPMTVLVIVVYTFIGYPFLKFLFAGM